MTVAEIIGILNLGGMGGLAFVVWREVTLSRQDISKKADTVIKIMREDLTSRSESGAAVTRELAQLTATMAETVVMQRQIRTALAQLHGHIDELLATSRRGYPSGRIPEDEPTGPTDRYGPARAEDY